MFRMFRGYSCCHATSYHSYCTGQAGIEARRQSVAAAEERALAKVLPVGQSTNATPEQIAAAAKRRAAADLYGESQVRTQCPIRVRVYILCETHDNMRTGLVVCG